jgi:hypothetical protein
MSPALKPWRIGLSWRELLVTDYIVLFMCIIPRGPFEKDRSSSLLNEARDDPRYVTDEPRRSFSGPGSLIMKPAVCEWVAHVKSIHRISKDESTLHPTIPGNGTKAQNAREQGTSHRATASSPVRHVIICAGRIFSQDFLNTIT